MLKYLTRLKIILLIILINSSVALCRDEMDAEEVVQKIEYNERLIQDVQCRLRYFEPETNLVYREDCEWGYENGKEFVSGTRYAKTEDGEILPYTGINAFDGKVVRSYNYDPHSGDRRGGIYGYDPLLFSVPLSPRTLLGYTLDQEGIYTLSELLSDKYVKGKKAQLQKDEDNEYIVLEATGFQAANDKPIYDVRIWIDPKRNYRPLKIEKYMSPDDANTIAGLRGERWKYLKKKVDNIELKQIDGIWFPVCGERTLYTIRPDFPLEGDPEEEIRRRYPGMSEEEIAKTINLVSVPFSPGKRIELSEIKINKGIEPAKFTIVFPVGCELWDDIVGMGYVVGDPKNVISNELENLRKMEIGAQPKQKYTPQPSEVNLQSQKRQEKTDFKQVFPEKRDAKKSFDKSSYFRSLILVLIVICLVSFVAIFFMWKVKK